MQTKPKKTIFKKLLCLFIIVALSIEIPLQYPSNILFKPRNLRPSATQNTVLTERIKNIIAGWHHPDIDKLCAKASLKNIRAVKRLGKILDARAIARLIDISEDDILLFSIFVHKDKFLYQAMPTIAKYRYRRTEVKRREYLGYEHDGPSIWGPEVAKMVWSRVKQGVIPFNPAPGYFRGTISEAIDSKDGYLRLDPPVTEEQIGVYYKSKGIAEEKFESSMAADCTMILKRFSQLLNGDKPLVLSEGLKHIYDKRGIDMSEKVTLAQALSLIQETETPLEVVLASSAEKVRSVLDKDIQRCVRSSAFFTISVTETGTVRIISRPAATSHGSGGASMKYGRSGTTHHDGTPAETFYIDNADSDPTIIYAEKPPISAKRYFKGEISLRSNDEKGYLRLDPPVSREETDLYCESKDISRSDFEKEILPDCVRVLKLFSMILNSNKILILHPEMQKVFKAEGMEFPDKLKIGQALDIIRDRKSEILREQEQHEALIPQDAVVKDGIILVPELGIHGRLAKKIISKTEEFPRAKAFIIKEGQKASCLSIIELMMLVASCGAELTLYVTGEAKEKALDAISEILENEEPKSSSAGEKGDTGNIYTSPLELTRYIISLCSGEVDVVLAKKDLSAIGEEIASVKVNFKMRPNITEGIDFNKFLPSYLQNFSFDAAHPKSIFEDAEYKKLMEYIESKRIKPEKGRYDIDVVFSYSDPEYIKDFASKEDAADIEKLCYCPSFLIRRRALRCLYMLQGIRGDLVSRKRLLAMLKDILIQDILDDIQYIENAIKNRQFLKETFINIFGKSITKKEISTIKVKFLNTGTEKMVYKITLLLKNESEPFVFAVASFRPNSLAHMGWETDNIQGADRESFANSQKNWKGLIKLKNQAMPALGTAVDFKIAKPVTTVEAYMDHGEGGVGGSLYATREKEVIFYSYEFIEGRTLAQILKDKKIPHIRREHIAVNAIYSALKIWLDTVNRDGVGVALLDSHPNNFLYKNEEPKSIDNERLVFGHTLEEYIENILLWIEREGIDPLILSKALLRLAGEALERGAVLSPSARILEEKERARLKVVFEGGGQSSKFMPGKEAFNVDEVVGSKGKAKSIWAANAAYMKILHAA